MDAMCVIMPAQERGKKDARGHCPRRVIMPAQERALFCIFRNIVYNGKNIRAGCYIHMHTITTAWIVLSLAMVFSILLTPFSMFIARRIGAVDVPCDRSVHTVAVPRLGGVGISLSFMFAVAFYLTLDSFTLGFLSGFFIIVMTGLLDDIKPLSHRFKFAGEIAAVAAFIGISGSELSGVGNLLGFGDIAFGPFAVMATAFCMVGLINAMNLCDGLDGLAGGLAIIAALFFAFLAYRTGQSNVMIIALALAGALLGFLLYNGFPARLFMGDVGSLMIGYTCAVLAVQVVNAPTHVFVVQPITIALILAVPLLDTLIVMGSRMFKGMSPFMPDKTHLHHRLLTLGLSQNQTVSIMYILMFLYGSMALLALNRAAYAQFYPAVALTMLLYVCINTGTGKPYRTIVIVSAFAHRADNIEAWLLQSLFDINKHYSRIISATLLLLAMLPLLFLANVSLALMAGGALIIILLLSLLPQQNLRIQAMYHGFLYLTILGILFVCHNAHDSAVWFTYWSVLVCLSITWVTLTMLVGHTRKLLTLHSFEILLILISWVVFFLFAPMLALANSHLNNYLDDVRVACVYAIPLLLLAKLCAVSSAPGASLGEEAGDDVPYKC